MNNKKCRLRLLKAGFGDECICEYAIDNEIEFADATSKFAQLMNGGGNLAFAINKAGGSRPLTEFDPQEDEDVLIVPAVIGG